MELSMAQDKKLKENKTIIINKPNLKKCFKIFSSRYLHFIKQKKYNTVTDYNGSVRHKPVEKLIPFAIFSLKESMVPLSDFTFVHDISCFKDSL